MKVFPGISRDGRKGSQRKERGAQRKSYFPRSTDVAFRCARGVKLFEFLEVYATDQWTLLAN